MIKNGNKLQAGPVRYFACIGIRQSQLSRELQASLVYAFLRETQFSVFKTEPKEFPVSKLVCIVHSDTLHFNWCVIPHTSVRIR